MLNLVNEVGVRVFGVVVVGVRAFGVVVVGVRVFGVVVVMRYQKQLLKSVTAC